MHPKAQLFVNQKKETKAYFYWLHWEDKKLFIGEVVKEGIFWKGIINYRTAGNMPFIVRSTIDQEVVSKLYDLAVQYTPELQDLYQRYPVEE